MGERLTGFSGAGGVAGKFEQLEWEVGLWGENDIEMGVWGKFPCGIRCKFPSL